MKQITNRPIWQHPPEQKAPVFFFNSFDQLNLLANPFFLIYFLRLLPLGYIYWKMISGYAENYDRLATTLCVIVMIKFIYFFMNKLGL